MSIYFVKTIIFTEQPNVILTGINKNEVHVDLETISHFYYLGYRENVLRGDFHIGHIIIVLSNKKITLQGRL